MPFSKECFEFVRTVLRERSAHILEDDKVYLIETRLLSMARSHGYDSVEELINHIRLRHDEELLTELVEAMTIKETYFFRDGHPFDVLRDSVLPALVRQRANVKRLNIWSAACSSGQEIYSIAILLRDRFPHLADWNIRLIASDLSIPMLERGRCGRYSNLEVSRGLPPELLDTCFQREGNGWQIQEHLRRMVEFRSINLIDRWPELPPLDLILLRNVLIYFDLPTKQMILDKIFSVLQPDGYLMLGGAETTHNLEDRFIPIPFDQVSVYQLWPSAHFL